MTQPGFPGCVEVQDWGSAGQRVCWWKKWIACEPSGKEFESAVESGDKPGVWTRGRNVERWQDVGPVEAWCLLHS